MKLVGEICNHNEKVFNMMEMKLTHVYIAFGSLASLPSPGAKAVAKAENRSSGSTIFSKCFNSFISFGAMLLRLLLVALYNRYIISFTYIIEIEGDDIILHLEVFEKFWNVETFSIYQS